ncbi:Myb-like_DNA-binding domain-containing protein [Hexamita inflata]|uniref:Myb-like DNA-binding domain-containing protein n=1 Tax=Hexamita inflata TaxID=28002 RepID=A0AA86Q9S6_9EUKA|nr:Myb-like DNA-binding domain-containing protein [Hexamita inflata]
MQRDSYTTWSDADIHQLLDQITDNTKDNYKINWNQVASGFKNRTAVQCKSFYNNKLRPFTFVLKDGVPVPDQSLILYCYAFYITRFKPEQETLEQRCRRIMAEACWDDIFPTMTLIMKGEINYNYNRKLLIGTQAFYQFHLSQVESINLKFANTAEIKIKGIKITQKQWNTFCEFINQTNPTVILKKIEQMLQKIL